MHHWLGILCCCQIKRRKNLTFDNAIHEAELGDDESVVLDLEPGCHLGRRHVAALFEDKSDKLGLLLRAHELVERLDALEL